MQFSKFAQNSPNSDIHMKQVSHPPFLGLVDDKKWSPFFAPQITENGPVSSQDLTGVI